MADLRNYVQGQDYTLAGSGCSLTATSIVATNLTLPNSGELITMTMFGTTGFATLEPETEREENISFTGITQNANGTATLTGVTRGLGLVAPYTQDTTLRHSHAGSTIFRFTNSVQFYDSLANKYNDETITGKWTYPSANIPEYDTHPTFTGDKQIVDKKYVDDSDDSVKVTATDTTPGYLNPKVNVHSTDGSVAVTKTITNPAGNEILDLDLSSPGTGGGVIVQEEGVPLATVGQTLNFVGDAVTATGTGATKTITVSAPVVDVQIFTTEPTAFGDSTTQFDITNPSGTTFRYTYDGTGTNPGITTSTFPTGAFVQIESYNSISAVNEGLFIITGSGTDYFEVTNTIGGAENDKTLGVGGLLTVLDLTWTKPDNAKAVEVVAIGGGGGGGWGSVKAANGDQYYGSTGGGGGAIARAIFRASDISSTVKINVGFGGTGASSSTQIVGKFGGTSAFGSYLLAYGGGGGYAASSSQQSGGAGGGTAGIGAPGGTSGAITGGLPASTAGANGIAGQGAGGTTGTGAQAEFGGAGGAGGSQNTTGAKGGNSIFGGGAGGSGGGINGATPGVPEAGGNGGVSGAYKEATGAATGGAATGVAGGAGTSRSGYGCGNGGAGGGAYNTGTSGAGGAGGAPGGGGGGGGANAVSTTGAVGGKGGRGEVRVYTYF